MEQIFQINAGMVEFGQNIVLNLIVTAVTALSWSFVFHKAFWGVSQKPKRWKATVYKITASVGTIFVIVKTWFFFGFVPPLVTAAGLLFFTSFIGWLLFLFIGWLLGIRNEEVNKLLKILLY